MKTNSNVWTEAKDNNLWYMTTWWNSAGFIFFILCGDEKFQIWFEPLNYQVNKDWRVCDSMRRILTVEDGCTELKVEL